MAHGLRGTIGNKRASAGICFEQSLLAKRFDRLAHCRAAHAELLTQLALRGQLITHMQVSLQDALLDLFNDLFIEALRLDLLVYHSWSPGLVVWWYDVSTSLQ